jgi:hypothetical protein
VFFLAVERYYRAPERYYRSRKFASQQTFQGGSTGPVPLKYQERYYRSLDWYYLSSGICAG